jgi:hypothetical protein
MYSKAEDNMKSKAYRLFFALLLLISLSLQFSSCSYRKRFKTMHDASEIVKIEIVEFGEEKEGGVHFRKTLLTIDNISDFMDELSRVEYIGYLLDFSPTPVYIKGELGIKISYKNGDYEIRNDNYKAYYTVTDGYFPRRPDGVFNSEQFRTLLEKHLEQCKSPIFYFMNDTSEIEKIEIVDAYSVDYEEKQDKIAEVTDVTLFLEQMGSLTYRYKVKEGVSNGALHKGHRDAVKIYYTNGDYEVIDNNSRVLYIESMKHHMYKAYIGEFNADEFNALLQETIKNNSVSP